MQRVYTPAKVLVAAVGMPVGAIAAFATGGNTRRPTRSVPTGGGTYFLTPSMMTGREPIEFFGSDYMRIVRPATTDAPLGSGATDARTPRRAGAARPESEPPLAKAR